MIYVPAIVIAELHYPNEAEPDQILVLHSDDQMCDRWAQAMNSARLLALAREGEDAFVVDLADLGRELERD